MSTFLLPALLLLSADPIGSTARPHGAVMGDGLRLTTEPGPVGGGLCPAGETVFGIDVSYYQGDIDWNAVAADGVEYAFVRVSHSTLFFDPQFDTNLAGSRAAGIHTGVYQYFEPDEDPIAQANLLLDSLGDLAPGDLPPVIDVESTGGLSPAAVASAVQAWVDHVEAELGVVPIIYTGHYFWQDNVASAGFGEHPLWLAWYGVECPGAVPTGWSAWAFHQYCDCGTVAGVGGPVDVNTFNGSLADLEALGASPEPCGFVGAEGGVIDNGDACYGLYGEPQWWNEEPMGEGGSLVWTHTIDSPAHNNYARWDLHFDEAGVYGIEAHIVQPFGQSTQARYVVSHASGEASVMIDQSAHDGWVSIGEFTFDADEPYAVVLGDSTGEPNADEVSLVFDAVRLTRMDGVGESSGGASDDSTGAEVGSSGGAPPPASTSGPAGGTTGDATSGSEGGASTSGGAPSVPSSETEAGGCRVGGSDGHAWLLLGVLGLLRRRRVRGADRTLR